MINDQRFSGFVNDLAFLEPLTERLIRGTIENNFARCGWDFPVLRKRHQHFFQVALQCFDIIHFLRRSKPFELVQNLFKPQAHMGEQRLEFFW
ncbi:MAG: hypothetical protein DDT34_01981 [Firmicutes bacterium]|nr:hypothetical protein [Bacillota bacterium]